MFWNGDGRQQERLPGLRFDGEYKFWKTLNRPRAGIGRKEENARKLRK